MISLVKNNQIVNVLLLLPYTILIRIHSFLHPEVYVISEQNTVLTKFFWNLIGENAFVHSVLGSLIIFTIAVLLGRIANKSRLFKRQNLYPSYFFVVFASFTLDYLVLNPALIALLFLTLFLHSSLKIYRNHFSAAEIFNMGCFAIISGLFYPPFTIMVPIAFFAIAHFKGIDLKDYLKLLFGVLSILLIFFPLYFYFDTLFVNYLSHLGISSSIFDLQYWNSTRVLFASTLGGFLMFGLLGYSKFLKKKTIDARKKISFLFIFMTFLLPLPLLFSGSDIYYLLSLSIIVAFFIAFYLDEFRTGVAAEIIHFLLLVILFGIQFNVFSL